MTLLSTQAFVSGNFSALTKVFSEAGFQVHLPLEGVLQINAPAATDSVRLRLMISVGVHGDETAPIEVMAQLLNELAQTPDQLAVDLLVAVGNSAAIASAKRFIDIDLNRLFVPDRQQFNDSREAARADQLMAVARDFFAGYTHKWHLDLHTAIRASRYATFAIIPGKADQALLDWLGRAAVEAVVCNPQPSVTFSSYTSQHLGAVSCTAELGRIGELGKNDLSQFEPVRLALSALLRTGDIAPVSGQTQPLLFRVAQELIKHSEDFSLTFDGSTENFTEFAPHTLIATDGNLSYTVGEQPEYVLFPNPGVRIGLRAGLLVVRV